MVIRPDLSVRFSDNRTNPDNRRQKRVPSIDGVVGSVYTQGVPTTKAIAYLRVSTDKQADHGVSLDAQRAKVEAYATCYDLELVDVIVDAGVSAKSLDRPGLNRALSMLRKGEAEALVVVKLDRLTRSVVDLGALVSDYFTRSSALMSVSENIDTRSAAGRLVLNVLASVSQWEREAIGERTSAAMAHKRASGEYTGGQVRYGYRVSEDGVSLVEDEGEQEVLRIAQDLRSEGLSFARIAAELATRGFVTRRGRPFSKQGVSHMVKAA